MDRARWLAERRAAVRAQYDDDAPTYDELEYPVPLHAEFIARLMELTAPGGLVLDVPCGTGRWFDAVVATGRRVVGADQSPGMLAQARARGTAERLQEVGLQELAFESEFDAAMTIDGMEHVPPEEWPLVVANLRRALRHSTHLYVTLEESNDAAIDAAAAAAAEAGLPTVRGEVIEGDTGGYHFYPGRTQALIWLAEAGFTPVAEDVAQGNDWGYRHLILRAD